MRKSFTRLFGLFMLLSMLGFYAVAQVPTLSPGEHSSSTVTGVGNQAFSMTFTSPVAVNSGAGIVSLNKWTATGAVQLDPVQILNNGATSWQSSEVQPNGLRSTVEIVNGNTVNMVFQVNLAEQAWYYITVSGDAFLVNGAPWGGIRAYPAAVADPALDAGNTLGNFSLPTVAVTGYYEWEFQVEDATPPSVTLIPADNSINAGNNGTGNPINTNLVMKFVEPVKINSVYNNVKTTIGLYNKAGNVVDMIYLRDDVTRTGLSAGGTITYTEPGSGKVYKVTLDAAMKQITIARNTGVLSDLTQLEEYYVRITKGAIVDLSGNAQASIVGTDDNFSWNFTAADNTRPTVTSPISGKKDVERRPIITLNFADNFAVNNTCGTYSFELQQGTSLYADAETAGAFTPANYVLAKTITSAEVSAEVKLYDGPVGGPAIAYTFVSSTNNSISIRPSVDLPHFSDITVDVNPGGTLQDGSGNALANKQITFNTGDFLPPLFAAVNAGRSVRGADNIENNGDDIIKRHSLTDQNVDIILRTTNSPVNATWNPAPGVVDIEDDQMDNGATAGSKAWTPLNVWAYAVPQATPATVPTPSQIKANGIQLTWVGVVSGVTYNRYEAINVSLLKTGNAAPDADYDVWFYAEDIAKTADADNGFAMQNNENVMLASGTANDAAHQINSSVGLNNDAWEVKKLDFHTTDNKFDAPVMTFTVGTASAVGNDAQIKFTFNEQVKSTNWQNAITITVPDNTFWPADADALPDVITFSASLDGTNKVLTIRELSPDRYAQDNGDPTLLGYDDFAELLSNVEYTVTFLTGLTPINTDRIHDDAIGTISNGAAEDDDPGLIYGSDNYYSSIPPYTFKTVDYEGPVAFFDPIDGSGVGNPNNVPITTQPTITFTEPIYDGLNAPITALTAVNHFELINTVTGGNVIISTTVGTDALGRPVVTLIPDPTINPLLSETAYRIVITQLVYDGGGRALFNYGPSIVSVDIEGIDLLDGIVGDDFSDLNAMVSVFETEDKVDPDVIITTVNKGDAALATAPVTDTDNGLIDVPVNAEVRVEVTEGVREVASNTLFWNLDENTIRTLVKLLDPAGNEVEYNIIKVVNGAGSGAGNDVSTFVYLDPIDYPTQPLYNTLAGECKFVNSAVYTVTVTGLEDDNNNPISMTANNTFTIVPTGGSGASITLSNSIPQNNQVDVALTQSSITLTFDQTVDNAPGVITLTQTKRFGGAGSGFLTALNVVTDVDMISANKTVWRYDLPAGVLPLQDDAEYTINITQASFETPRVNGAAPAAVWPTAAAGADIVFTTVDKTGPSITIDGINVVNVDADAGVNLANFEVYKDLVGVSNPALPDMGDKLLFTFNETDPAGVKLGTSGHLWIKRVDTGLTVAEWGVLSTQVKINAAKQLEVTIPGSLLEYGTDYFVEMDGSFITDQDGNPYTYTFLDVANAGAGAIVNGTGGFFGANKLLFSTWADTKNVTFANFVPTTNWEPYQNENQVATDISRFAIVFTGPAKLSPNINVNDELTVWNDITVGSPITSVPVQSLGITWSDDRTVAYISVASIKAVDNSFNIVGNTKYWIDIDPGAFSKYFDKAPVDEINNNAGGTWNNSVSTVNSGWYWATWDWTPPTVISVEPVTSVTNVVAPAIRGTIGTDIKVTFSEPIELTPAAGGNWANAISVTGTGTSVISGGNLDATNTILTLTMNPDFERDVNARLITVGIKADADLVTPGNQAGISDLATNKNDIIASANVGTFTIQDLREPIITQFANLNTTAGTSAKLDITVDEPSTVWVYYSTSTTTSVSTVKTGTSFIFDGTAAHPLAQTVTVTGLSECSSYYFYMVAQDAEGNISDNNATDNDNVAAAVTGYSGGVLYAAAVLNKMHDVTPPEFVSTYPAQGAEIPLFNTYYQIPASTATALKMYFSEDIIDKASGTLNIAAGKFHVREYETNVDVGVTATIKSEVVATVTHWYVQIVPTAGAWPAGKELYVECDYGIITDTDCAAGANNDWTGALYGKDNTLTTFSTTKWWFKTGTAHVPPTTVAILNHDGTNLDGNQAVVFDPTAGANKGFITLRYNQPVQFVPGKLIYVYKYEDAVANPHEVITVNASNVEYANGNKDVKVYVRYLVNDLYKEHYRLVFEAGTILDAHYNDNYGAADLTTKDDLTPRSAISPSWNAAPRVLTMVNANNTVDANGLISTDDNPANFVAGVDGNRLDGPFIDFWALDTTDPVAVWSSEWVTEWNGNRYYGPNALPEYGTDAAYGDQSLKKNFPTRDVAAFKKNANADNSDFELTAIGGKPNRTIYLSINEQTAAGLTGGEVYVFNPASGSHTPLGTVNALGTVKNAFTIPAIDANGDKVEFNVTWNNVLKRAEITFNQDLPAKTVITINVSQTYFADVDNNPTSVSPWEFTTWYDQSPTVQFNVTTTGNNADLTPDAVFSKAQRAESKPIIEFTFDRKVLLRSNYQVLQDVDVLDLVTLFGPDPRTLPVVNGNIPLTVVKNVDGKTYQVQPTIELVSEGDYVFTIVSDGDVSDAGGVDIDLVDDVRKYTLNGNMFDQPLAARQYTFEVEDNISPNSGLVFYPADNAGPIKPQDPLFGTAVAGGGKYIVVDFGEAMQFGAAYTNGEIIEIRRAYEFGSGPESQGPGSIYLRVDKSNPNLKIIGSRLWIPITNGFENFMGYYVFIPANFVMDKANWSYIGITAAMNGGLGNQIWNFATDDGTPPIVVDAYPPIWQPGVAFDDAARNDDYIAENINIGADWWLKFDENVDINQNGGKLVLYKRDDVIHGVADDGNAVLIIDIKDLVNVRLSGSDPQNNLSSNIVTFQLPTSAEFQELMKSDIYYIRYYADAMATEGIVKDRPNGNYAANRTDFSWAFGTSSHASPQVTALTPLMDAPQEPVLTMTFDMDVLPGNGKICIYEYNYEVGSSWNSRLVHTITLTDVLANLDPQVEITNNLVTITPAIKLDDNVAKYYVLVDAGAFTNTLPTKDFFKDIEGELGIFDDTDWAFNTLEDAAAPALVDGSLTSNVDCARETNSIEAYITLTDYNGIQAGAGNFLVMKKLADGTLGTPIAIPANDARVTGWPTIGSPVVGKFPVEGMKLTLALGAENLDDRSVYVVQVENNAILDASRQPVAFAGIDDESWMFTINDWTAPAFVSATPAGIDVEADTLISIEFAEPIQVGANPVLTITGGVTPIFKTITDANIVDGNMVVVELTGLDDMTPYIVSYPDSFVFDMAYETCTDLRGAVVNSWTFTTDDNTAPVLNITRVAKSGDKFNIKVVVDEAVAASMPNVLTLKNEGVTVKTIDVDAYDYVSATADTFIYGVLITDLVDGLEYTAYLEAGAFVDGALNANVTNADSLTFNTGDNTPPALVLTSPLNNGEASTYIGLVLSAKFNEPVSEGMGKATITGGAADIEARIVKDITNDSTVIVVPASQLGLNITYSVLFNTTIEDNIGNVFVQDLIADEWSFTIVDDAFCSGDPVLNPVDGATGVRALNNVVIDFCENVNLAPTGGFARLYKIDATNSNRIIETIILDASMFSDQTLTIETNPILYEDYKQYGVMISPNAVVDEAGNFYAGDLNDPTMWNFTMGDNTHPFVENATYPSSTPDGDNDFEVVLKFNETVVNVNTTTITVDKGEVTSVVGLGATWTAYIHAADGDTVNVSVGTGIKDANDNELDQVYVYTYIVGDNTVPTMSWLADADPQDTTFNVTLIFSEPVTGVDNSSVTVSSGISTVSTVSETEYVVTIQAAEETTVTVNVSNAVVDSVGNAFAGDESNYVTGDFTGPTVTADPVSGTTDMDTDFEVKLTFTADAVVTPTDITVEGATTSDVTNVDNVYTVSASAPDYTVVTINVANTIVDEVDNAITGNLSFEYTVGDNTAPILTVDPEWAQDTVNVFDLTLSFDEPVNIPTGAITVSSGTIVISPINDHVVYKATIEGADNATVVMTVGATITDMSGNAFGGQDFTYTIGDNTAPTVTVTPGEGTNLGNSFEISLAFNEAVTGVVIGQGVEVVGGTATITGADKDYKITVNADDKATVTVVLNNVIADIAGNKFEGGTYIYTVGDNTLPTVTVTPGSGTDMPNDFTVALVFSEPVTGVEAGVTVTGGTKTITGTGTTYAVAINAVDGSTVKLSLAATIKDADGNPLAASSYTYTVVTAPPVLTIAQIQGTGDVSPKENLIVTTKGSVTGIDAAKTGFFMQDAMGVRNGIYVFDSALAAEVGIGTSVQVTGTVKEYYTLTEIGDITDYKFVSNVATITPEVITADKIATEAYEGVLVRVQQLKATALEDAYHEWMTAVNGGTSVKIDDQLYAYTPDLGQFYDITGIVNYSFSEYKLAPRNVNDISKVLGYKEIGLAMDIYPNPFDESITIKNSSDVQITKAVITNIAGQLVKEVINPNNTIKTSELHSGVYFISLHTVDGIAKTERIIKR